MHIAPYRHILKCLKGKSQNISISCRSSHIRQACNQFVCHYSHSAASSSCQKNANFLSLRNNCPGWIHQKYKTYCPPCPQSHSRGFVTAVPDADVDKDLVTVKDNNKHSFPDTCSSPESDDVGKDNRDGYQWNTVKKCKPYHIPVMAAEVIQALQPQNGQVIVDMTFGAGGHAQEILKVAPDVCYCASDRDPLANSLAVKLAAENSHGQITPILSRFSEVPIHLHQLGIQPGTVDAFLFDLGASSMQFDMPERGFSLSQDGPLDMRMDGDRFPDSPTAADVVNNLSPSDLAHVFKKYGEEKKARQIAQIIVEAKYAFGNFTRTKQLADVILSVFNSGAFRQDKLSHQAHVATKCFQALRIFVNNELNELNNGLEVARHYLKPSGRCVVISFHSLEDRIVKRHFLDIDLDLESNLSIHDHYRNANVSFDVKTVQDEYLTKLWQPLFKHVQEPSHKECQMNPRSRSAKMRAALKV